MLYIYFYNCVLIIESFYGPDSLSISHIGLRFSLYSDTKVVIDPPKFQIIWSRSSPTVGCLDYVTLIKNQKGVEMTL